VSQVPRAGASAISSGLCNFTKGERSEHEFPISILLYRNRLLCFSRLRFLSRLLWRKGVVATGGRRCHSGWRCYLKSSARVELGGCKSPARAYRAIASCSSVGPCFRELLEFLNFFGPFLALFLAPFLWDLFGPFLATFLRHFSVLFLAFVVFRLRPSFIVHPMHGSSPDQCSPVRD